MTVSCHHLTHSSSAYQCRINNGHAANITKGSLVVNHGIGVMTIVFLKPAEAGTAGGVKVANGHEIQTELEIYSCT